jgi:hypothetical protein
MISPLLEHPKSENVANIWNDPLYMKQNCFVRLKYFKNFVEDVTHAV